MRVSVIIPAYVLNQELAKETQRCIDSLKEDEPEEIVLIDNGSPFHTELPYTHRIETNAGYSGAVNLGLREATGDVLVVGNNDLQFPVGWLAETKEKFKKCHALAYRQSDQPNVSRFASIWAISRSLLEDVGFLDEQFFTAFADTDYWRRTLNAGYEIPRSDIIIGHTGSKTFKADREHDDNYSNGIIRYREKWGKLE